MRSGRWRAVRLDRVHRSWPALHARSADASRLSGTLVPTVVLGVEHSTLASGKQSFSLYPLICVRRRSRGNPSSTQFREASRMLPRAVDRVRALSCGESGFAGPCGRSELPLSLPRWRPCRCSISPGSRAGFRNLSQPVPLSGHAPRVQYARAHSGLWTRSNITPRTPPRRRSTP